jgi:hypothetical protein
VSWQDLRHKYLSILSDMGFRSEIDSDGDIHFTYEGGNYYITNNCDDTYFFMLYPGFWQFDNKNEQLAGLLAANITNRRMKVAKILLNSDMDRASVTLECYIHNISDVQSFLMRGLRCMQEARKVFRDEIEGILS